MTDHAPTPPLAAYPSDVGRSSVGALDALAVSYRLVLGQMRSTGRIIALLLLSLTATVAEKHGHVFTGFGVVLLGGVLAGLCLIGGEGSPDAGWSDGDGGGD